MGRTSISKKVRFDIFKAGRFNVFTVREAMEIACARKYSPNPGFKYFCGICWNKIKDGET